MKTVLPKILITGAAGQLGTMLKQLTPANFELISCDRHDLDITDSKNVLTVLNQHQPQIVINTTAYTAVDKAEDEKDAAHLINAIGAENIAKACQQLNLPLIHLSTDYVFSGSLTTPYREEDSTQPLNYYGESKLLGEQAVQAYCEKHIILRVSGIYSAYGNNFYKTILRLAKEREELRIVADQISCPTYAGNIAQAIYTLCRRLTHFGIYHFCSQPEVSWYEFAKAIIDAASNRDTLKIKKINAITAADYASKAIRPAYSVLNCDKIARDYGITQPNWKSHLCL